MEVGHLNVSRAPWYDRTTAIINTSVTVAGVAPHNSTTRATYTVPSGVRSFLDVLTLGNGVSGIPTASAVASARFEHTPSGGAAGRFMDLAFESDSAPQESRHLCIAAAGQIRAGDVISFITQDQSTGGSRNYQLDLKANEYAI